MGENGATDLEYAAWAAEGAAVGQAMRMQEEEALSTLSMSPARAADAMVSLFEETLDRIEHPLPIEDMMTPAELATLREEEAANLDRFRTRCGELIGTIGEYLARPESNRR